MEDPSAQLAPPSGSVAVLLYHEVADGALSRAFRRFAVSAGQLEEHLSALWGAGLRTGTLAGLCGGTGPEGGGPTVVLTFDDAFASFATQVLPLLGRYGMRATLYVPTAFVGGRAEWLSPVGEGDRRLLDWEDLREAAALGVELGAHGHRHLELDAVGHGELAVETAGSKALLEDRVGVPVRTFAYPFGYHDREVRRQVQRCGYEAACEVGYGLHQPRADPFAVRRLLVHGGLDAERLLAAVASGRTTPLERLRRATRPAWRAYRRRRRGRVSP